MNYYEVLGIDRNATIKDVKKAYHKLALRWHPDKNQNNLKEATKKFREITEAYDTLSDETKRRNYDVFGTNSAQRIHINPDEIFKAFFAGNDMFRMFGNAGFNINVTSAPQRATETTTKRTFINNGEVITKTTTTKTYPDGTQNVTEQITRNKVDASIRNKTPTAKKKTRLQLD